MLTNGVRAHPDLAARGRAVTGYRACGLRLSSPAPISYAVPRQQEDAARVVLVRAVEEILPERIAAGAIAGMYVRGLFFAYRVTWESTFVNDPGVVAFLLRGLLGPAAHLLGRPLPAREDVLRLLAPEGDPAGSTPGLPASKSGPDPVRAATGSRAQPAMVRPPETLSTCPVT
jgi:hypothetical protein